MATALRPFLQSVILAPTIDEERIKMTDELANMRTLAKEGQDRYRPRVVAKLLWMDSFGLDIAWGEMEIINLMSHERVSFKRIGYLAAGHVFDERNERIVLITSTVQKDLGHADPAVQRVALTLISSLCTPEMGQSLATAVIRLASSSDAAVKKCVGLAATNILKKCPELVEQFRPIVAPFLNHPAHCVVAAGILLAVELIRVEPSLLKPWSHFAAPFAKTLKVLFDSRPSEEYRFGIYNDPFLQIRILQVLGALRDQSDELDDVLSAVVTGVDIQRSSGRSILLAAVRAIGTTAKKPSLRSLAFNQVGRLFTFPQPNILYTALSMFTKILYSDSDMLDRTSADSHVLQRYRSQVVHCLDHRDPSIRRRALDVVAALVDETNAETFVPEVMAYLKLADREFRTQLVAKVFASIQRFAPSVKWNFDTVLKLLRESGSYVGPEVVTEFCRLIARNVNLRPHAVAELGAAIRAGSDAQPLVQVAAWALGEFQETESDAVQLFERVLAIPQTTDETKGYLLTAIAKLAVRFGQGNARALFEQYAGTNHLEIQQRAGELLRLLDQEEIVEQILAPAETEGEDYGDEAGLIDMSQAPQPDPTAVDELIDMGPAAPASPAPVTFPQPILAASPAPPKEIVAPPRSVEAMRTPDYVVFFEIRRNAANPRQIAILSTVFGLGSIPLTQFVIQYGVPHGWAIQSQPPSADVLAPIGGGPIQQVIYLENRGTVALSMLTQTTYLYGTQPIKESGRINPIFN
jgi:hypothetical protein